MTAEVRSAGRGRWAVGLADLPPGALDRGRVWAVTLRADVDFLNANYLFASLIWGSVGLGYFIFGKKQHSVVPLIAGLGMMVVSYFAGSVLVMSFICGAIVGAVYLLAKRGF